MVLTPTILLLVMVGGVWGETFITSSSSKNKDTDDILPSVTTPDPFLIEHTTFDSIRDDFDTPEAPIPNENPDDRVPNMRPIPAVAPTLSAKRIPSLASTVRVRPAIASRKSPVPVLRPRKIASPLSSPLLAPRRITPISVPASREIVIFDSRKISPSPFSDTVPTGRKMPSLPSRKNSARTGTSRESSATVSDDLTSRKIPDYDSSNSEISSGGSSSTPALSVLRIRPVPSSLLRNRHAPSSLIPTLVESPVVFESPPTIKTRPTPSPSFPILIKRPNPAPSSPFLTKRFRPFTPLSVKPQNSAPVPSSISVKRPKASSSWSSRERQPIRISFKTPDPPIPTSTAFAKSFDSSPAPIQSTPLSRPGKFQSFPNSPKLAVPIPFTPEVPRRTSSKSTPQTKPTFVLPSTTTTTTTTTEETPVITTYSPEENPISFTAAPKNDSLFTTMKTTTEREEVSTTTPIAKEVTVTSRTMPKPLKRPSFSLSPLPSVPSISSRSSSSPSSSSSRSSSSSSPSLPSSSSRLSSPTSSPSLPSLPTRLSTSFPSISFRKRPLKRPSLNLSASSPSSPSSSNSSSSLPSPPASSSLPSSSPITPPRVRLSSAQMPRLSGSRSAPTTTPPPAPRDVETPTTTATPSSPRNRFLVMLKRKQEKKEDNLIGQSPCRRGTEGRACRRKLALMSRTCSSGTCEKCRQGCSTLSPSEWPGCCRDHLLCCRHLAASCRTCDHPELFPFCGAAFKKCG